MNNFEYKERTSSSGYGTFHIYDNLMNYKVQILLPKNYNNNSEKFPVIYMNDGQTAFESGGLSPWSWEVDKTLNNLHSTGLITSPIIVAIFPHLRNDEYLPVTSFSDGKGGFITTKGQFEGYSNDLVNSLKPYIDKNYSVLNDSKTTSIVGSSFGGIAALFTALRYPEKFGICGALSASFTVLLNSYDSDINLEKNEIIKIMNKYISEKNTLPKIWIDAGKNEGKMSDINQRITEYLCSKHNFVKNENIFYFEDPLGTHDERAWQYRFNLFLSKFYRMTN